MLKKETTGLRHPVAFFPANLMFFYNVINVGNDVFTYDGGWIKVVIMCKEKTHLLCVIADGAWRIMFGSEHCVHLLQGFLSLKQKCYFTVLIFFS